jgi:hypothetical protein
MYVIISIKKYRVAMWLSSLISDSNEQLTGLDTLYILMDIHPLTPRGADVYILWKYCHQIYSGMF